MLNVKLDDKINVLPGDSVRNNSRGFTFLDSYIYMKNRRYNALYEKNKRIMAIENDAINLRSADRLYEAFIEEVRMLDTIVTKMRNFILVIKNDVLENISILMPDADMISEYKKAIFSDIDLLENERIISYRIEPIQYENMRSFINLLKIEINDFLKDNESINKTNPFIRNKATKYLIDVASQHANLANELLAMEKLEILTPNKLKKIAIFFNHKVKIRQTIIRDFKVFVFYLRQYLNIRKIATLLKPTQLDNGDITLGNSSVKISFNDYLIIYKHFDSMVKYMIDILSYHELKFFNKIYALESNIEIYRSVMSKVIDKYNKEKLVNTNITESINLDSLDDTDNELLDILDGDKIKDVTDEAISNFEDDDLKQFEVYPTDVFPTIDVTRGDDMGCTLRDSLNF